MLNLVLIPEAAKVLWWLYENETMLMTHRGDRVTCSTGVMQGWPLATIAFSLVVKWLVSQLTHSELEQTQFYMVDGLLFGTTVVLKWCLDLIDKLEHVSGLKLKLTKISAFHCFQF